jgi:hypothetical protein
VWFFFFSFLFPPKIPHYKFLKRKSNLMQTNLIGKKVLIQYDNMAEAANLMTFFFKHPRKIGRPRYQGLDVVV